MRRGRLYKGRVHGRHGLAAFLAVLVAVRCARHRIAALHRLIGRRHGQAVKGIRGKGDDHHREKNWPNKTHLYPR